MSGVFIIIITITIRVNTNIFLKIISTCLKLTDYFMYT